MVFFKTKRNNFISCLFGFIKGLFFSDKSKQINFTVDDLKIIFESQFGHNQEMLFYSVTTNGYIKLKWHDTNDLIGLVSELSKIKAYVGSMCHAYPNKSLPNFTVN